MPFSAVVVQDFDGAAVEDGDDFVTSVRCSGAYAEWEILVLLKARQLSTLTRRGVTKATS